MKKMIIKYNAPNKVVLFQSKLSSYKVMSLDITSAKGPDHLNKESRIPTIKEELMT